MNNARVMQVVGDIIDLLGKIGIIAFIVVCVFKPMNTCWDKYGDIKFCTKAYWNMIGVRADVYVPLTKDGKGDPFKRD